MYHFLPISLRSLDDGDILAYHLVVGIVSREAWAPKSPCLTKLLPLCQLQGSIGPIHPARDQLGTHGDDTNKRLLSHGPVCLLFISPLGCQRSATSKTSLVVAHDFLPLSPNVS